MNPELISRVVNLVQKSGDKVVLADPVSGKAVVVMDLEAYELIVAATVAEPEAEHVPAPTPVAATVPAYQPAPPAVHVPAPTPAPAPEMAATAPVHAGHAAPQYRPQPITPPAAPVRGPVSAEQIASAFGIPASKKQQHLAKETAPEAPKKGIKVTPETMGTTHVMADLTQEQLIDKINRDIGAWKTAQETRRTTELKAAASEVSQSEPASALEEEERFFLEPIE